MKRAVRRHHRERLAKVRKKRPGWPFRPSHVDTPTPCSCAMCCNRRKLEGKTLQERKFDQSSKEDER